MLPDFIVPDYSPNLHRDLPKGTFWSRSDASGPWVGLLVAVAQPIHRDVGVELGGGQGTMAEQFLDGPQVGTAIEQVGCCCVA